ncbi:MAG TPA: hypothetical protein VLG50_08850, partial [Candidatus Saccharimonadales bacterium]|nr:hypothetical protein [Candidatus Saccharimonadales bacterium]
MNYSVLLQGFIIGFTVATSIGISGALCLQNMMTGRIGVGIASALGAASADAIYAIVMIFGLQAGQSFLNDHAT